VAALLLRKVLSEMNEELLRSMQPPPCLATLPTAETLIRETEAEMMKAPPPNSAEHRRKETLCRTTARPALKTAIQPPAESRGGRGGGSGGEDARAVSGRDVKGLGKTVSD
jgi:hypothetical protein